MTRYDDILARLRAATGPSNALDWRVDLALFPDNTNLPEDWPEGTHSAAPFRYTSSIDATLVLVEKMLPGWLWKLENGGSITQRIPNPAPNPLHFYGDWPKTIEKIVPGFMAVLESPPGENKRKRVIDSAPTPSLAILIALFTALAAQEAEHG